MYSRINEKRETPKYLNIPYLRNYYSDYHQLSFHYHAFEKRGEYAFYRHEENAIGSVSYHSISINLFMLKVRLNISFDSMLKSFITSWNHEFFHLIGLTEEAMDLIREKGMNV